MDKQGLPAVKASPKKEPLDFPELLQRFANNFIVDSTSPQTICGFKASGMVARSHKPTASPAPLSEAILADLGSH